MTFRSIARAVWYQDIPLARLLTAGTEAGATHIAIDNNSVKVLDHAKFEAEFERVKKSSLAEREAALILEKFKKTMMEIPAPARLGSSDLRQAHIASWGPTPNPRYGPMH